MNDIEIGKEYIFVARGDQNSDGSLHHYHGRTFVADYYKNGIAYGKIGIEYWYAYPDELTDPEEDSE